MENVNRELNLDNKEIIGKGSSAIIYALDNASCYKKIYNKEYVNEDGQAIVLETIKNLKLSNFCKIKDINFNKEGNVLGYTMERYRNYNINILSMPKDYLIDSYRACYNDILKLSEKLICIKDLKINNVFYTENGLIIHDYDLYTIGKNPSYALYNNIAKLNCLFNEILSYELTINYKFDSRIAYDKVNELFNARTDINTLEGALNKYNRPIDFIRGNYGIIR